MNYMRSHYNKLPIFILDNYRNNQHVRKVVYDKGFF